MARKKGVQNFNLSLIRHLMRVQSKTTTALAQEIDVTRGHLSRVLTDVTDVANVANALIFEKSVLVRDCWGGVANERKKQVQRRTVEIAP